MCVCVCVQLVGLSMALIGASLYFSTDRLPYMSSVLLRDNAEYGHGVPSSPVVVDDLPFIFVAVGLLLSVVSFLGCCGACADSVCFMAFVSESQVPLRCPAGEAARELVR